MTATAGSKFVSPKEIADEALLRFTQLDLSEIKLSRRGEAAARATFSNYPHKEAAPHMLGKVKMGRGANAAEIARFTAFTDDERIHYADEIEEGLRLAKKLLFEAFGRLSNETTKA